MTLVIGEYAMPDPEVVSRAEYTAIHQVLADKVGKVKQEDAVAEAMGVLDEFQAWAQSVKDKLEHVHQVL